MDARRFDALARIVSTAGSRRRAVATAVGGVLALLGLIDPHDATAKKKCPPCKKRKQGKCKKKKPDGTACPGGTCQGGSCIVATGGSSCPDGQRLCGTRCILPGQCCTDTDCPTGTTCCGRLCVDTTSDPRHCGACATPCTAVQTCAGGRCCTARYGAECTATSECCGTDFCDDSFMPYGQCVPCTLNGGDCFYTVCCPGLFCVRPTAGGLECAICKPKGEPCQGGECCDGLFCRSGNCAELEPF